MSNKIEICNAALLQIAANTIENLSENTREATVCNAIYSINFDSALRDVDWSFARKGPVVLTQLSETSDEFDYVYSLPADCIEFREIYNVAKANDTDLIPFKRAVSQSGDTQIILTDEYQAKGIYTKRIENESVLDPLFVSAFTLRLASSLSYPIQRDESLKNSLFKEYLYQIETARRRSKSENFSVPNPAQDYVSSR